MLNLLITYTKKLKQTFFVIFAQNDENLEDKDIKMYIHTICAQNRQKSVLQVTR